MWVAEYSVWHEGSVSMELTEKYDVTVRIYLLNVFYEKRLGVSKVIAVTGKDSKKYIREIMKREGHRMHFTRVEGKVKIILNAHDLGKLEKGDVLVSPATSPVMVPGMRIAGAIVTDQGGLTCHAAIVSRELRKPCVIGTKIASKSLKDGDLVEVDTMNGIVRKI